MKNSIEYSIGVPGPYRIPSSISGSEYITYKKLIKIEKCYIIIIN